MSRFPLFLFIFAALLLGCPTDDDDDVADDDSASTDDDDDDVTDDDDDDTGTGEDLDGDGYPDGVDCNDEDPDIHPDAAEVPYDGIDQDCDGEDLLDADGDGYDTAWFGGDDCDDEDPDVHPGADETCGDTVDADCTGDPDDGLTDADGDGFIDWECTDGDDCDDGDASVHPGMEVDVPGDHATIADAANAVCNDSQINVDEGNYYDNVDAENKSLRILGTGDADATFLMGDGNDTALILGDGGVQSQLTNITVLNGVGTNGGGVRCAGDCLFDNVVFQDNEAYFGGGLCLMETTAYSINGCTFTDNTGEWGGGLYVEDGAGTVTDTTFGGNIAGAGGGGISCWFSDIAMGDLDVYDGHADQGGGLHIYTCTGSLLESTIHDNTAMTAGGMQTRDCTLDLLNNSITDNYAEWGGGGYYCWDSTVTSFETNTIENNAVYDCDDYVMWDCEDAACRNCNGC